MAQTSQAEVATEQALIDRWIEPDPNTPGEIRLAGSGVHLWAIIGSSRGRNEYLQRVAHDYAIPVDAVRAAHAYYRRYPLQIDARIEANAAAHA